MNQMKQKYTKPMMYFIKKKTKTPGKNMMIFALIYQYLSISKLSIKSIHDEAACDLETFEKFTETSFYCIYFHNIRKF